MEELDISYALAKKVPDMQQRGFRIETAYGEIEVEPGELADRIVLLVHLILSLKLAELRQRASLGLQA